MKQIKLAFLSTILVIGIFACTSDDATDKVTTNIEISKQKNINDDILKVAEQMPRFPGCENEATEEEKDKCAKTKMLEYIYKNIEYPKEARENEIEGMVVIQFVVSEKGEITDVKIVRDVGGGCGLESEKVVKSMNDMPEKWTPGKQDGQNVKVLYTLPVKFKLE